jgi:hypothetical protein
MNTAKMTLIDSRSNTCPATGINATGYIFRCDSGFAAHTIIRFPSGNFIKTDSKRFLTLSAAGEAVQMAIINFSIFGV